MPMSPAFQARLQPHLPRIVREFGTPFHLYDEQGIIDTCQRMKTAFGRLPGYLNYFAVKALPNPRVLKLIHEQGFGFDCSSVPELNLAREAGARWHEIMFTSNNTSPEEFACAMAGDGCYINLDDVSLIRKVPEPFPSFVSFRYNPGKARTGNSIIGKPHEAKYGITTAQLIPAYREAIARGASGFGLHAMLCSNERRVAYMVETVKMLLDVCAMLEEKLDIQCAFINMGGGFGIPYRPGDRHLNLELMARRICSLMQVFSTKYGFTPRLVSECGRFVTGPSGVLVSQVTNQKLIWERHVQIDAGMPALMRHAMYGAYHHIDVLTQDGEMREGNRVRVNVVGSICENCDRLATHRLLPADVQEGDLIVTHDTGAHGIAMGFNYNGRTRPQELMLRANGSIELIRRAETEKDLRATLSFAPRAVLLD